MHELKKKSCRKRRTPDGSSICRAVLGRPRRRNTTMPAVVLQSDDGFRGGAQISHTQQFLESQADFHIPCKFESIVDE